MDAATLHLFALSYEGRVRYEDYVQWAVDQMQLGRESDAMVMLAGLSPPLNPHEVRDLFSRSMRELDLTEPDLGESLRWQATELLKEMTVAQAPTETLEFQVRRLAGICKLLNYPEDLFVWCELDEDVRDRFSFLAQQKWFEAVRDAADAHMSALPTEND